MQHAEVAPPNDMIFEVGRHSNARAFGFLQRLQVLAIFKRCFDAVAGVKDIPVDWNAAAESRV